MRYRWITDFGRQKRTTDPRKAQVRLWTVYILFSNTPMWDIFTKSRCSHLQKSGSLQKLEVTTKNSFGEVTETCHRFTTRAGDALDFWHVISNTPREISKSSGPHPKRKWRLTRTWNVNKNWLKGAKTCHRSMSGLFGALELYYD